MDKYRAFVADVRTSPESNHTTHSGENAHHRFHADSVMEGFLVRLATSGSDPWVKQYFTLFADKLEWRADAMSKTVLGELVFHKAECTARWVTALKSGFAVYADESVVEEKLEDMGLGKSIANAVSSKLSKV
jgi:hypothetical protein